MSSGVVATSSQRIGPWHLKQVDAGARADPGRLVQPPRQALRLRRWTRPPGPLVRLPRSAAARVLQVFAPGADGLWLRLGGWDESETARIEPFEAVEVEVGRLFLPREA